MDINGKELEYPASKETSQIPIFQCPEKLERLVSYNLDLERWRVNVQACSEFPGNMAILSGVVEQHNSIMNLDLDPTNMAVPPGLQAAGFVKLDVALTHHGQFDPGGKQIQTTGQNNYIKCQTRGSLIHKNQK